MKDIDWSKAPEGYPVWIEDLAPGTGFDGSGWHRDDGDRYTGEDGEYWTKPEEGIYRVHSQAPQWGGTGLPPVGVVCNMRTNDGRNTVVKVLCFGETRAFVRTAHTSDEWAPRLENVSFSAIRTPEQIAAEEREAAINCMEIDAGMCATAFDGDPEARMWIENLIDKGWRKAGGSE